MYKQGRSIVLSATRAPPDYLLRIGDETAKVTVLHEGEKNPGLTTGGYAHADNAQNMRMLEVLHESALSEESLDMNNVSALLS
jgi:hypothetical protein